MSKAMCSHGMDGVFIAQQTRWLQFMIAVKPQKVQVCSAAYKHRPAEGGCLWRKRVLFT